MESRRVETIEDFLKRTGNLLIHLLNTCNLHCKHCYLNATVRGAHMLPFEIVERTLDEAHALGMRLVQFSGGEPLLYPHLTRLLRLTKGKSFQVGLSTNGTLMNKETAALLREIGAYAVVSVDGPSAYHDVFRGKKGSFRKTAKGVACLVNHGVPVKMVTTICTDNFQFIHWCANWAYQAGVGSLQFQPLEGVGRGAEIKARRLSQESLHDLFIHLSDLAVSYQPKGLKISMTYQSREYMLEHPCSAFVCNGKNCHRGVEKELKKIVVREDGAILPELVDIDRKYQLGNLYNGTLRNSILAYLEDGYSRFDRLCRTAYKETVADYPSPLIPWNEILSEKSREIGREQAA